MGPSLVARVSLLLTSLSVAASAMGRSSTGDRGPSSVRIPAFHDEKPLRRVCYFTLPPSKTLSNATADLCTHLICGFAAVSNGSLVPRRPEDAFDYDRLVALKLANPALKVMLSLGTDGKDGAFSAVIATKESRHRFLESAVTLLRQHGFDGLDLDWEFPGQSTRPPEQDRENLGLLLKEARKTFRTDSRTTRRKELLLSIAVPGTEKLINQGYDAKAISRYCDFINLMSYDYHMYQPYLPFTGHNSPLFKRSVEESFFATLHVAWSAEYWVQRGADRSALNVGLAVYGRTFTLLRPESHGFDAPATGVGPGYDGGVDYVWVCQFLKRGATAVFDDKSQVPYAYQNRTWVGYDDVASIRSKVVWTMARGFGGVMTFALNHDDADNACGQGFFPIHTMIRNMLQTS